MMRVCRAVWRLVRAVARGVGAAFGALVKFFVEVLEVLSP